MYRAALDWRTGAVFVNGARMVPARFPNAGADLLRAPLAELVSDETGLRVQCAQATQAVDFWKGATLWGVFYKNWVAQEATVKGSGPGSVTVATKVRELVTTRGYLTGVLAALDTQDGGDTGRGGRDGTVGGTAAADAHARALASAPPLPFELVVRGTTAPPA